MLTKLCTKCKEEKETEQFNKVKRNKDGFSYNCNTCLAEQARKLRRAHGAKPRTIVQETEKGKICTKCGEDKTLDSFAKASKSKDGLDWYCKKCRSERAKVFNSNALKTKQPVYLTEKTCTDCNITKLADQFNYLNKNHQSLQRFCKDCEKAYKREYHKKNREKICLKSRSFYEVNSEQVKERIRNLRKENPEYVRMMEQKWRENNRDKKTATDQRRYSKKLGNGGSFSAQEWLNLKSKYNFTCLRCGLKEPQIKLTVDHVLPLYWGGRNEITNIQPLCKSCNSSKNAKLQDYRMDSKTYGEGWKRPSLWG